MNYEITTPRLHLRPIREADIDAMHAIWLDPKVLRYFLDGEETPRDRIEEIVAVSHDQFRNLSHGLWCIETTPAAAPIGFAAYWWFHEPPQLELMYGLGSAHWGQGFATEAAAGLIHYGLEHLQFDAIKASTDVPNVASTRVLERLGFKFDQRTDSGLWGMLHFVLERDAYRPVTSGGTVSYSPSTR